MTFDLDTPTNTPCGTPGREGWNPDNQTNRKRDRDMSIHTITVTQIINDFPDVPDDEFTDDVKYTIDHCPGGACTVWWECRKCDKGGYEPTEDEADEGEYEAHGELHRNIDGDWMTESTDCAAATTDSGSDAMQDAAQNAGIGAHKVSVTYWGDGIWEVNPTPESETTE